MKFIILVFLHILPLVSHELHEKLSSESYSLCKGKNEMLPIFLHFSSDLWIQFHTGCVQKEHVSTDWKFYGGWHSESNS